MQTICGIDITKLVQTPTPEELGSIIARWNSEDQAMFFISLGEELRNCCGGKHFMQWQAISDSIAKVEQELCDGSASELINEVQCRLAASAENEKQNAAEAAYERHCEDFHDGGCTRFISLEQQQADARRLK